MAYVTSWSCRCANVAYLVSERLTEMGTERLYKAAKAAGYALATSNELLGIKSVVTVARYAEPQIENQKTLALPAPADRTDGKKAVAPSLFGMFSTWTTSRA